MIAESVRHALSDSGHSHLPLCPDYEGGSPKGEPLELRFPVKTGIVMDKPPALAVGCMTWGGINNESQRDESNNQTDQRVCH